MLKTTLRLVAWLSSLAPKAVSAEDMLARFGPTSPVGRAFIAWCYERYNKHSGKGIVEESYNVWRGLYKEATNLDDDAKTAIIHFADNMGIKKVNPERFLFAIETYMAVLMKLLVAEVSIQKDIVNASSLRALFGVDVVDTYKKLAYRIPFLRTIFEEDIFDWFLEAAKTSIISNNEAKECLADVADALDNLDFRNLRTDLIRDLYHGFFDRDTRRALGEFYTNDAIVDEVLSFVNYDQKAVEMAKRDGSILLDPSCGSGTFLVRAIDRWRPEINKVSNNGALAAELLKSITTTVIGIDIHPFAVAMARVNYLLAIIDLLLPNVMSQLPEVRIPIYWTDSLVIREPTIVTRIDKGNEYQPVEIEIPVLGKFVLPCRQDINWDDLATNVHRALDGHWSEKRFLEEFPEKMRLIYKELLVELYHWFSQREKTGKDGRWISVLTNAVIVHQLQGKCSYVVGNPPWVRIHNIDETIRNRIRKKFLFYRAGWMPTLAKTKVRFKEQYDYCMAFVESGLRLLSKEGKLGFVITSKVMQALYAGSMRKALLEHTRILYLKDYSLSEVQLFKDAVNYPLLLILGNQDPSQNMVHIDLVSQGKVASWQVEQDELPLIKNDKMSPWMIAPPNAMKAFRRMQLLELPTGFVRNRRLGDVYDISMGVKTSANDIFVVQKLEKSATEGLFLVETKGGESVVIEEKLLAPLVRGEDIAPFQFSSKEHIIWTHDGKGKVLTKLPRRAKKYFRSKAKLLRTRDDYKSTMPTWQIFRVSPQKLKKKAAWHELARRMEAVLLPEVLTDDVLGERQLIAIQTVYFIASSDAGLLERIVVLLNSTPVRAFLSAFAERARGSYFRHFSWTVALLPFPQSFDTLSNNLMEQSEIDLAVAGIFQLDSELLTALSEYHQFIYEKPESNA